MIVYVSFKVSMNDLWLKDDPMEIEVLRLELLEQARRLHAQRVKEGHRPDEGDVEVERVESIGGLDEGPVPGGGTAPEGSSVAPRDPDLTPGNSDRGRKRRSSV